MEMKKIKVKVKKKKDLDVKKPIKVKVKKRKENNVETSKLIKVYCAKKFYEKYLQENETPTSFIQKLKFDLYQIDHLFRYNPDDLSNEELVTILTDTVDLNKILSLMFDKSINLKAMGTIDDVIKIGDKIRRLVYVCVCDFGYSLDLKYNLHDIAHRLNVLKISSAKSYDKTKIISLSIKAMKNDVIVDVLSDTDSPYQPHLKGCSFLVEYKKNKFINIPYEYYKRLYDVDKLTINLRCCDSEYLYNEFDDPDIVDPGDIFYTYESTTTATTMKDKISISQDYLEIWDTIDKMSEYSSTYFSEFKESVLLEINGKEIVMDVSKFLSYYFEFLVE